MHKPYITLLIYNLNPILYCRSSSKPSKIGNSWRGLPLLPNSQHAFKWADILLWEKSRGCSRGSVCRGLCLPFFFIVRRCKETVSSWIRQMNDAREPDSISSFPQCAWGTHLDFLARLFSGGAQCVIFVLGFQTGGLWTQLAERQRHKAINNVMKNSHAESLLKTTP